jgi:hypothetical protein
VQIAMDESSMIGNTISHHRIIDKLGQEGMGQVFLSLVHTTSD